MKNYEIIEMLDSSVLYIQSLREEINLAPEYQTESDIWTKEKKQLLIDTLLNEYDMPKIYLHEFSEPCGAGFGTDAAGPRYKFAVIDGKQRLFSIFDFIDNKIALADDFVLYKDERLDLRGMKYSDIAQKYPRIKIRFDGRRLPVFIIRTTDEEVIEDMFSRFNAASSLNAAEKRNALGGPVPVLIRKEANHPFFREKVAFTSARYKHYDVIAKMLYLLFRDNIYTVKKNDLDLFVKSFKNKLFPAMVEVEAEKTLDALASTFANKDELLKSPSTVLIYFWLSHLQGQLTADYKLDRPRVVKFEDLREENRRLAAGSGAGQIDMKLLEYDRLLQTPNDASSIRFRCEVASQYLLAPGAVPRVLERLRPENAPALPWADIT